MKRLKMHSIEILDRFRTDEWEQIKFRFGQEPTPWQLIIYVDTFSLELQRLSRCCHQTIINSIKRKWVCIICGQQQCIGARQLNSWPVDFDELDTYLPSLESMMTESLPLDRMFQACELMATIVLLSEDAVVQNDEYPARLKLSVENY